MCEFGGSIGDGLAMLKMDLYAFSCINFCASDYFQIIAAFCWAFPALAFLNLGKSSFTSAFCSSGDFSAWLYVFWAAAESCL